MKLTQVQLELKIGVRVDLLDNSTLTPISDPLRI
jgi:hypothetical protein